MKIFLCSITIQVVSLLWAADWFVLEQTPRIGLIFCTLCAVCLGFTLGFEIAFRVARQMFDDIWGRTEK